MNRITKVALCVGLAGIGVFAWTRLATAGKPVSFPVRVTFFSPGDIVSVDPTSGDVVSAESQIAGRNGQQTISIKGTVNASIDFGKYYEAAANCSIGDPAYFSFMQEQNLSSYVLDATVTKGAPPQVALRFTVMVGNILHTVIMNQFASVEITSVGSTDIIHASGGRVAVYAENAGKQHGQVSTIKAVACDAVETFFSVSK